jgi:hypothetical protein
MRRTGIRIRAGCKREEKRAFPNPAKEVTDKISSRSIRAPLNPRKKKRIQSSGTPKSVLIKPPAISTPSHMSEEKKESPEQRLKSKIGAPFSEL